LLLLPRRLGDGIHTPAQRPHRAVERSAGDLGPPRGVRRKLAKPLPQRFHSIARQHTHCVQRDLGHNEEPGRAQAFPPQHGPQVRAHFHFGGRRDAVHNHSHHDVPGRGVEQELPGDGIGVAVGSGDKHPEAHRSQQLTRKLAVVIGDRVDVGSVQQRNAFGHAQVADQDQ
jgi:hypothetical protein